MIKGEWYRDNPKKTLYRKDINGDISRSTSRDDIDVDAKTFHFTIGRAQLSDNGHFICDSTWRCNIFLPNSNTDTIKVNVYSKLTLLPFQFIKNVLYYTHTHTHTLTHTHTHTRTYIYIYIYIYIDK